MFHKELKKYFPISLEIMEFYVLKAASSLAAISLSRDVTIYDKSNLKQLYGKLNQIKILNNATSFVYVFFLNSRFRYL